MRPTLLNGGPPSVLWRRRVDGLCKADDGAPAGRGGLREEEGGGEAREPTANRRAESSVKFAACARAKDDGKEALVCRGLICGGPCLGCHGPGKSRPAKEELPTVKTWALRLLLQTPNDLDFFNFFNFFNFSNFSNFSALPILMAPNVLFADRDFSRIREFRASAFLTAYSARINCS
jgi:hypothetical protein